ncbi:MAG: hypothetical protein IPN34_11400 [Planctomycetes bacterium]|nr:hypothetical protein [Planctomycetota bacterium]
MKPTSEKVYETRLPFPLARAQAVPRWPDLWDLPYDAPGAYPFARALQGSSHAPQATQRALVLESATLRAELLPELGGRLFVRHLPSGKELFLRSPEPRPLETRSGHARIPGGLALELLSPRGAALAPAIAWHTNEPATLCWALPHPSAEISVRVRLELVDEPQGFVLHVQVLNRGPKNQDLTLHTRAELALPSDTRLELGDGPATYVDLFTHALERMQIGGHDLKRPAVFPYTGRVELEDRPRLALLSNGLHLQHVVRCSSIVGRGVCYAPRHGGDAQRDSVLELRSSLGWPHFPLAAGGAIEWSEGWFVDAPPIEARELPPHPFPVRADWTPRVAMNASPERVRELCAHADAAVPDLLAARAFLLDDEKDQSEMRRIAEARPDQIVKLLLHALEAGTWERLSGLLFLLPEDDAQATLVEAAALLEESGAELARERLYALDEQAALAARPADPRFATHLEALVRTERSSPALPYVAALSAAAEQRWAAALELVESARLRGCETSEARYLEALTRLLTGRDLGQARALALRVQAEHPGERAPALLADAILRQLGEDEERLDLWRATRAANPHDELLRDAEALALFEADRAEDCLAALARSPYADPAPTALRRALWCAACRRIARELDARGELGAAESAYRRALETPLGLGSPELFSGPELYARLELAQWLLAQGRTHDAEQQLAHLRERLPKSDPAADRLRSAMADALAGGALRAENSAAPRTPAWPRLLEDSPWR